MKMHGCKTLIILAAMLCLFSVSGAISGKMFSPAEVSDDAADVSGTSGDAEDAGVSEAGTTSGNVGPAEAGSTEDAETTKLTEAVDTSGAVGTAEPVATIEGVKAAENTKSGESAVPVLSCRYFNEKDFLTSVNGTVIPSASTAVESADARSGRVKGGIVPHHLLAGRMIAAFFRDLSKDPPGTIIMIAPNHKLVGANEIHTSAADWMTAFGKLEAEGELVKVLADRMKASENNALMENDHSISSHVPYIKYYMPDTKIVPVLLHGSYSQKQSEELGALLAEIVSERPDTVILASIDFSHYLDVIKADEMDELTLAAIRSWDIDELNMMSNDNLDSSPSIITLLTAMDTVGARDIDVTGHSNSSRITYSGYDYTTSYYTMFFRMSD